MNTTENRTGLYHAIIKMLHILFASIRAHIVLFIVCVSICSIPLVIGAVINSNYYKASFTIAYDELFRKVYGDRLGKLNSLVQRNEYSKLAYNLHTNIEIVKSLQSIEGKNILGDNLSKDMNTDNVPFIVNIVVKDSATIIPLQNAIVSFLEIGNDFLQERKSVRLKETNEELAYINRQMAVIDSLNSHGVTKVFEVDKSDKDKSAGSLFEFGYQLYKRKQELVRKERMPSSLFVVDDAIVSVKAGISPIIALAIGIIAGAILFIVIALFIIPAMRYKA
jgi:hypothetical protein